ncbi:MAG: NAD-glutamate dehydrogenase, partial [Proteobacteria bacterium]|nr:NAD-glutamate dehydrogenase [Pseudomonadota bacterium]
LDIGSHIQAFRDGMSELAASLTDALPPHYVEDAKHRAKPYVDRGVPEDLALRSANLVNLYSGSDIVQLATRRNMDVLAVAKVYFAVGTRFRMGRLRAATDHLGSGSHWQQLAVAALVEEIYSHQLRLAEKVLDFSKRGVPAGKALEKWLAAHPAAVGPTDQMLGELWSIEVDDLAMIAVASRQLRAMVEGSAD